MKNILLIVCIIFAGCAGIKPQPATIKVEVPVPVPCIISQIELPDFAVDDLSVDAGIWPQMLSLRAERIQRKAYEHVLEQAIKACQK